MRSASVLLTAALAALSSAVARSSTGDRVLVVLESQVKQDDYSKFWASLKGGHLAQAHRLVADGQNAASS